MKGIDTIIILNTPKNRQASIIIYSFRNINLLKYLMVRNTIECFICISIISQTVLVVLYSYVFINFFKFCFYFSRMVNMR